MKWGNHGAKRAKTHVICTIGPACRSPKKIEALIAAGMNVARLHFSYSGQKEHAEISGEYGTRRANWAEK